MIGTQSQLLLQDLTRKMGSYELHKAFKKFDKTGEGTLDKQELRGLLLEIFGDALTKDSRGCKQTRLSSSTFFTAPPPATRPEPSPDVPHSLLLHCSVFRILSCFTFRSAKPSLMPMTAAFDIGVRQQSRRCFRHWTIMKMGTLICRSWRRAGVHGSVQL